MAARSVDHIFSLCFDYLWVCFFPVLVLGAEFGFWLLWFLIFACFLLLKKRVVALIRIYVNYLHFAMILQLFPWKNTTVYYFQNRPYLNNFDVIL